MGDMYKVRERLCEELDDLMNKRPWTPSDLEQVKMITASIHYVDETEEIAQEMTERYSGRGRQRDSMGRYSGRMYPYYNMTYSNDGTNMRSGDDESLRHEVEELRRMVRSMGNTSGMRN